MTIMNKWLDHTKNMKNDEKNLSANYHWNFPKKKNNVRIWHFIFIWLITICVLYIISQNNNYKFDCFHINTKKKSCLNDTQIKIRFYNSFHYLHTLLRCDSIYDRSSADCLMTSRHKRLIVELEFNEQFFFSWEFLYNKSEHLIVQ